jgi:prepilin-type N-terminal cleavage/methylation domain-containing protein
MWQKTLRIIRRAGVCPLQAGEVVMLLRKGKSAFTLVELVLVIVIIGVLAAVAIPRLSRGSAGAGNAALATNLAMVRNAINLYAAEHNNTFPGPDAQGFVDKLTKFSDRTGTTVTTRDDSHPYGPYLLAIPPCPVGENANKDTANKVLISTTSPPTPDPSSGEGWVYNATTGEFLPNTDAKDDAGKLYKTY